MDAISQIRADVDELTRRFNENFGMGPRATELGAESPLALPSDPTPVPIPPPTPPAANLLRNGDFAHSRNTWEDSVAAPAGSDSLLECAHWFSNDPVAAGQLLDFTTAAARLKAVGHSSYDPNRCDWGLPGGIARFQGLSSLDALFPPAANAAYPSRTMHLGAIVARRDETIFVRDTCRLAAMLYSNDPNELDIMESGRPWHLSGAVRGVPAATEELRYRVFAKTDRGYEFLSDELVIANAPTPASFSSEVDVFLSWPAIDGILEYRIIRHRVSSGIFDELARIGSGATTYGDNNRILYNDVGGYPAASDDRVRCYVATLTAALSDLPIDGVALKWASVFLNIPVPAPLAFTGSGNQVLRLALTEVPDRQMTDAVSTAASATIESAKGNFTDQDSGRSATLLDEDENILHGPETISFVDSTHVNFATPVATSNVGATLLIEDGGDHGILIDMVHAGTLSRATYAPYSEDKTRALPPTAVPSESYQGGMGSGGETSLAGDGGLISECVSVDEMVTTLFGNSYRMVPFGEVPRGQVIRSGNCQPNVVQDVRISECDNLHILRTRNGLEICCSPRQVFFRSVFDRQGVPLFRLRKGDLVLTSRDGHDECSEIIDILATGKSGKVGTFRLAPGHRYLAGHLRRTWWRRFTRSNRPNGFYVHNAKLLELI